MKKGTPLLLLFEKAVFNRALLLASLALLSACASSGRNPVSLEDIRSVGFSHQQVIGLGRLINSAYVLFDGDPLNNNPDFPVPFTQGYTPIMNLQAEDNGLTSGRELYGHLSTMDASSGTLVISIRGTSDHREWVDDAKFFKEPFSDNPMYGRVEKGFKELFNSFTVAKPGDQNSIPLSHYLTKVAEFERLIVAGHSLGASLTTLVAFDASVNGYAPTVDVLTFASPLTGDQTFVNAFQSEINTSLRIVNKPDIVPRVPPKLFGFRHVWHELEINSDNRSSVKRDLVCYHNLQTYLYILTNGKVALKPECHEQ